MCNVLKENSRKGDFVNLVERDVRELKITISHDEIQQCSKGQWKQLVKKHVRETAFSFLEKENNTKEKTKSIKFKGLQMRDYLRENRSSSLSRVIFAVRSKTLDIKAWNIWKYNDDKLCWMSN